RAIGLLTRESGYGYPPSNSGEYMTITVLLVDDHPVVRTGLRAVLDTGSEVAIVAEAASGAEALTLAEHFQPDVVLCDLQLGVGMDGIQTARALRKLDPAPTVLILSTYDRDADVMGAMDAGAAGYILKDATPETIIDGIQRVAAGETVLAPPNGLPCPSWDARPTTGTDRTRTRSPQTGGHGSHQ